MPGHHRRFRQEQAVYDLIVREFMPKTRFTAADVYEHESGPKDLDMYAALNQLVFEKKLMRVERIFDENWHDTSVYAVAGEDGYRTCFCRDCFETTIGPPGEMCTECEEAGCQPDSDCDRPDAYGVTEEEDEDAS